jgi:hypothetical protein
MLVHETADGFRAPIGALRSLDANEGVNFHTFSLPEDRCVRLLLKNLGKRIPEAEIREELEALHKNVHAVMQLRSKRRDQDPEKDRPLTPHFIVSVARGPDVAKARSLTDLCGLRVKVETYNAPKGPLQCKRCQRFGHTQRNYGYAPRRVACGDEHPSGKCVTIKQELKCCSCGGNHNANYRGCSKWKEAKAATARRAQGERSRKDGVTTRLPAPKSAPAKPSPEQEKLGSGYNHVVRGGRVVKAQATPTPASTSSDTGRRTEMQVAPTGDQRKPASPEVSVVESQSPRSKQTDSSSPQGQSPLEGIADLLEKLPTKACVELTRRLLSVASSIPTGEARPRAQNRNPFHSRVWLCGLEQTGDRPCGWFIGMLLVFAAGSWNWNSSSVSTALISAS